MKTWKERVDQQAEIFQKECHRAVEVVMANNEKVSHQDATNVWFFRKLAELELKIQSLESYHV